jgi:hypothetical protein
MQRKKPDVDVIMDVLKQALDANPASEFLQSLMYQYQERGGLSKKQLQGLHGKASKIKTVAPSKLATLEAIILKKHEKQKSEAPKTAGVFAKDEEAGRMIDAILERYPQHKRVIFYKNKYDGNAVFSAIEKAELEKFYKLLVK